MYRLFKTMRPLYNEIKTPCSPEVNLKGRVLNLDLDIRGKPVFLAKTRLEVGFVDDVIIDPTFGILAVVAHGARFGTWAFPYRHVHILRDGITVVEQEKQSPRRFLRNGSSYQDLLGGPVLDSDGSVVGRIRDVELVDCETGQLAYRVSPSGVRSLWTPNVVIHASTAFIAESPHGIVLKNSRALYGTDEDLKAA